jgi:hypothetical protein
MYEFIPYISMNSFFSVIRLALCSYQEPPGWGAYKPGIYSLSQIFGSKELTFIFKNVLAG